MKGLCWRPEKVGKWESIWSLARKFACLNQIRLKDAFSFFMSTTPCWPPQTIFGNSLQCENLIFEDMTLLELDRNCLEQATIKHLCDKSLSEAVCLIPRFCQECLKQGYHSPVYQLPFLGPRCPIHNEVYRKDLDPFGDWANSIRPLHEIDAQMSSEFVVDLQKVDVVATEVMEMNRYGFLRRIYPLPNHIGRHETEEIRNQKIARMWHHFKRGRKGKGVVRAIYRGVECSQNGQGDSNDKAAKRRVFRSLDRNIQKNYCSQIRPFLGTFERLTVHSTAPWKSLYGLSQLNPLGVAYLIWSKFWRLALFERHKRDLRDRDFFTALPNELSSKLEEFSSDHTYSAKEVGVDQVALVQDLRFSFVELVKSLSESRSIGTGPDSQEKFMVQKEKRHLDQFMAKLLNERFEDCGPRVDELRERSGRNSRQK